MVFDPQRSRHGPMSSDAPHQAEPLFCDRCSVELRPGAGNHYVIKIEAFADPTPPSFSGEESPGDVGREIERVIAQTQHLSEQELMDQVYRRLTLFLCGPCYRHWIE